MAIIILLQRSFGLIKLTRNRKNLRRSRSLEPYRAFVTALVDLFRTMIIAPAMAIVATATVPRPTTLVNGDFCSPDAGFEEA